MKRNFFIKSKYFDDLYLKDVLIHYDYPRIFICEDFFGSLYLFTEFESEYTHDTWLVQQISQKRYFDLFMKQISIQGSYKNPEIKKFFIVTKNYTDNEIIETETSVIPDNSLTDTDTFVLSDLTPGDDLINFNSDILRFIFFEGTNKNSIDLKLLNSILNSFTNFYNSVSEIDLNSVPDVRFREGSLIMEIKLNEHHDLFSQANDKSTLKNINKVFNADNDQSLLEALDDNSDKITKYKSLLSSLKNVGSSMRISSTYMDSKETKTFTLEPSDITYKIDIINNIYKEVIENIAVKGRFSSANLKSRRFIFIDDETFQSYNGTIDASLIEESTRLIVGEADYNVVIEAKSKITKSSGEDLNIKSGDVSYKIISYELLKK